MLLRILVAGPEGLRINRLLAKLDALVTTVAQIQDLAQVAGRKPFDLVLADVGTLDAATFDVLRDVRDQRCGSLPGAPPAPPTPLVVLTRSASAEQRARCMSAGCSAVIDLGVDDELLADAFRAQLEQLRARSVRRLSQVPGERHGLADYAATSQAMQNLLSAARKVAGLDTTVLILGETGVGKGLLAQALHHEGPRADGPFITVNCGSLSATLIESEIFGHERGSFTGAERSRRGHFELAHGGTIFLDEVSELPLHLQVKLLRVLEDRRIQPLGSERPVAVDVRVIAATNRDLAAAVQEKSFRSDLFYRLNVVSLLVPPLRERREDIPELARGYLAHFAEKQHSEAAEFSKAALGVLTRYAWPGNVRELINAVERATLMSTGRTIEPDDLPADLRDAPGGSGVAAKLPADLPAGWPEQPWSEVRGAALLRLERRYLEGVLKLAGGRVNEAAERAGMDPRSLYEKLKRHGLRKEDYRASGL